MYKKSIGIICHEIGHMFGMLHCTYYKCIMNGTNSDQESSWQAKHLCAICLKKLYSIIKFDILEWEKALSDACSHNHYFEETKLYHDNVLMFLDELYEKKGYTKIKSKFN